MILNKEIFQLCNSINEKEALQLSGYTKKNSEGEDTPRYLANIKYDGHRIVAIKKGSEILLINRRSAICNFHFQEIVNELMKLKGDFVIDGEIISKDDDFTKLQKRALTKTVSKLKKLQQEIPVVYKVFDILRTNEEDVRYTYLDSRLQKLRNLFNDSEMLNNPLIQIAEYKTIDEMWKQAKEEDREGIIVKDMSANYQSGRRTDSWQKCKRWEECVLKVVKYTENPAGIRVEDEKGISVQVAGEQHREVKDLIDAFGFAEIEVQYLEKTAEGMLRFPSYRGLKKDEVCKTLADSIGEQDGLSE